jgi:hypothetical protein
MNNNNNNAIIPYNTNNSLVIQSNNTQSNNNQSNNNQSLVRHSTNQSSTNQTTRVVWTDPQIRLLINERFVWIFFNLNLNYFIYYTYFINNYLLIRRRRNFEYWYLIPTRSRIGLYNGIANTINSTFGTNFTGIQCQSKFDRLVHEYNVRVIMQFFFVFTFFY